MSRNKSEELHSGRLYSKLECMLIFFAHIRGFDMGRVARSLGRSVGGVHSCWIRMCYNASAKDNMKTYDFLRPFSDKPWSRINSHAEDYIHAQIFTVKKKSNAKKISKQTGIPIKLVKKRIDQLSRLPQKEAVSLLKTGD